MFCSAHVLLGVPRCSQRDHLRPLELWAMPAGRSNVCAGSRSRSRQCRRRCILRVPKGVQRRDAGDGACGAWCRAANRGRDLCDRLELDKQSGQPYASAYRLLLRGEIDKEDDVHAVSDPKTASEN